MLWLNQTWTPYSSAKSRKVLKFGKDISYETTPDYLMLAQWQLHEISLETCMSGQGLACSSNTVVPLYKDLQNFMKFRSL